MTRPSFSYIRVLGISPARRGFGFAVLEARGRLVSWGVAQLKSRQDKDLIARIDTLFRRYQPALVVLEDCSLARRRENARRMIEVLLGNAHLMRIEPMLLDRERVRAVIGLNPRATKYEIAIKVADVLPELLAHLPGKRRPWDTEAEGMSTFAAASLALAAVLLRNPESGIEMELDR